VRTRASAGAGGLIGAEDTDTDAAAAAAARRGGGGGGVAWLLQPTRGGTMAAFVAKARAWRGRPDAAVVFGGEDGDEGGAGVARLEVEFE
jgi:hypothetical protein